MVPGDQFQQLQTVVETILGRYDLEKFNHSWDLCQEVLAGSVVRRFYVTAEPGYANVAILTDQLLVDVEGDDENESTPPGVTARHLSAISGIDIVEGPVEHVPDAEDAELVVSAYVAGSEVVDLHWIANTADEKAYLLMFGQSLIKAMAES